MLPDQVISTFGLQPVRVITLGTTSIPEHEFHSYIAELQPRFTSATYDLIHHNCNHFSNTVVQYLLNGTGIPADILNLPQEALSTPIGYVYHHSLMTSVTPIELCCVRCWKTCNKLCNSLPFRLRSLHRRRRLLRRAGSRRWTRCSSIRLIPS